ncbi:hypothetical protein P9Y11_22960 [Bacillus cereus]|nr:hypothetical protein [Bacillus cereus]
MTKTIARLDKIRTTKKINVRLLMNFDQPMHDELNALAIAAGEEINAGIENGTKFFELIAYFSDDIEDLRERNWHKMNNEMHFVEDCVRKLKYGAKTFDQDKGNFIARVSSLFDQSVRQYCGNRGNQRKRIIFNDTIAKSVDSQSLYDERYQYADDKVEEREKLEKLDRDPDKNLNGLAVVDYEATVEEIGMDRKREKELIDKYGSDDVDRVIMEIIMEEKDYIKQAEISRRLADRTGKSFDSARGAVRKFIRNMKEGMTTNDRYIA